MKTQAGLWIDHEHAVLVLMGESGETVKKFHIEEPESAGETRRPEYAHKYTPNDFISEDSRQRKRAALVEAMYDEVLASMSDVQSLWIVGPGEAKREFNKHLQAKKVGVVPTEFEAAGKLSERQLIAKVKEHFASTAP